MIDHKSTGKRIKAVRRELFKLIQEIRDDDRRKGNKIANQLVRSTQWIDKARTLLDGKHAREDRETFDTHTYYGEDRE